MATPQAAAKEIRYVAIARRSDNVIVAQHMHVQSSVNYVQSVKGVHGQMLVYRCERQSKWQSATHPTESPLFCHPQSHKSV